VKNYPLNTCYRLIDSGGKERFAKGFDEIFGLACGAKRR
jgi:hypothetical protein